MEDEHIGLNKWKIKIIFSGMIILAAVFHTSISFANVAILSWDANTEADLLGYKIYYGTHSGVYESSIDVGNQTSYTISGLGTGTYYFALTSYDLSRQESAFSIEVNKTIEDSTASVSTAPSTAPSPAPVKSTASTVEITQLNTNNNTTYEVVYHRLAEGEKVFIDRTYTYADVPGDFLGASYIRTANNDKTSTGDVFFSFHISQDASVFVAHDDRISPKPLWLREFSDTAENITIANKTHSLFQKDFPAGVVILGGNDGPKASMYTVILKTPESRPPLDTSAPSTPSSLSANGISSSEIRLSWLASTDNVGVLGYRIFRDGIQVATTTSNTYTDSGLSPETMYAYTVNAFDEAGNTSALSTHKTATTEALPDLEPPSIPAALSTISVSSSDIQLSWLASTDNVGVLGYRIFRNGIQVATTTSNTYTDSGLSPETLYTYTVNAFDEAGNTSALSASSIITISSPEILTIQNVWVDSGLTYELVHEGLANGAPVYIDRTYLYADVPPSLKGLTYLKTANGDKAITGTQFLSLTINQSVTLLIAHDDRITTKPAWLDSFTDTGENLTIANRTHSLWEKHFSAGTVMLGGNAGSGYSMYTVIIKPPASPQSGPPIIRHTIGTNGRDFTTLQGWEDAREGDLINRHYFSTSGQTGPFLEDEIVFGVTSGAQGQYVKEREIPSDSETKMSLDQVTGIFRTGEALIGATSGARVQLDAILSTQGTIEQGEAYADQTFRSGVTIEGSTTDENHYMWLNTPVPQSHRGNAGQGVVIDIETFEHVVNIRSDYTRFEGFEITQWPNKSGSNSWEGVHVAANHVLLSRLLIHNDDYGTYSNPNSDAINLNEMKSGQKVTIQNSMIYNIGRGAINYQGLENIGVRINNVTIYNTGLTGSNADGEGGIHIRSANATLSMHNTITMNTYSGKDFKNNGFYESVSNNLSSDDSAPGINALLWQLAGDQFISIASGNEDLHLKSTAGAVGTGIDLSGEFTDDIDGNSRTSPWDIGADER